MSTESLLRTADPLADVARPATLDARALADRERIVGGASRRERTGPRAGWVGLRRVAWVAGLAAVGLVVSVNGVLFADRHRAAEATTPPVLVAGDVELPARDRLSGVAERLLREAAPGESAGTTLAYQSWALWTRVDGTQVTSAVVPQRIVRDCDGQRWCTEKSTAMLPEASDLSVADQIRTWRRLFGGVPEQTGEVSPDDGMFTTEPPDAPAELMRYLSAGHPIAEQGTAELFIAVGDLLREWSPTQRTRAQLLQFIASRDDVVYSGAVTDRLGRTGHAYSVDHAHGGLPTRSTMIVDERTGRVLGLENVLTETPGALNVPIPSTLTYTAFE